MGDLQYGVRIPASPTKKKKKKKKRQILIYVFAEVYKVYSITIILSWFKFNLEEYK